MKRALFNRFRRIVAEMAGIDIREGKEALVEARVSKRMRALHMKSPERYLDYLLSDTTGEEAIHFLNVVTTHHTGFFREPEHFTLLHNLMRRKTFFSQPVRFWSVAASTGEEAYSIALSVDEPLVSRGFDYKILATDLSTACIETGARGEYPMSRLSSVARFVRNRYFTFTRKTEQNERIYTVRPEIKRRIMFRRLNLATPPFPMKGPFDAIFCRNVMIYLDRATRKRLMEEIERLLGTEGLLFIGHAETLSGLDSGLEALMPSVFCRPGRQTMHLGK